MSVMMILEAAELHTHTHTSHCRINVEIHWSGPDCIDVALWVPNGSNNVIIDRLDLVFTLTLNLP